MGKSNRKLSSLNKTKRKLCNSDKANENVDEEISEIKDAPNELSKEHKQKKLKLNNVDSEVNRNKDAGRPVEKRSTITARTVEDEETFETEVEGQNTEFASDNEIETEDDFTEDDEDEEEGEIESEMEYNQTEVGRKFEGESSNNNETKIMGNKPQKTKYCNSEADTESCYSEDVMLGCRDPQEIAEEQKKEERAFFERFKQYMAEEGIINVTSPPNPITKESVVKVSKVKGKGIDRNKNPGKLNQTTSNREELSSQISTSEATIYQAAVPKRVSSSSEDEPINTSNELNDILIPVMTDIFVGSTKESGLGNKPGNAKYVDNGALAHGSKDDEPPNN